MEQPVSLNPAAKAAARESGPVGVLRHRNFRLLWLGEGISVLGDHFSMIAMPWLVLQLTGDALAMGAVTALQSLPRTLFMLIGGAFTDRFSPRTIMLASNLLRLIMLAALAGLVWTGAIQLWMLYVYALAFGVVSAFFYPANSAIVPRLLPADQLQAGNALVMGTATLSMIVGPALAGVLISAGAAGNPGGPSLAGLALAFAADALTFFASLAALALIRLDPPAAAAAPSQEPVFAAILTGLRFVGRDATLRTVFLVGAAANFLTMGPVSIGLPLLADTRFGEGAAAFGLLMSASAAGMLVGMLLAGVLPRPAPERFGPTLIGVYAAQGLTVAALAITPVLSVAAALALASGTAGGYVMVVFQAWFQRRTPAALLGRMMSLLSVALMGLTPVSTALAGALSGLGVTTVMAGAGLLMTVTVLAFGATRAIQTMGLEPASAA